jgi:molecular chaperone IbpA
MNELDIIRNHFLGFNNDFFDNFRTVSTYPPYNVREKNDLGVIEFAVAGFAEGDLKVEVKDQTLKVSGSKEKKSEGQLKHESDFYHKGISDRTFRKSFKLHEHIRIDGAELKDGLLKVTYKREIPESEKPKVIEIKSKK